MNPTIPRGIPVKKPAPSVPFPLFFNKNPTVWINPLEIPNPAEKMPNWSP